MEEGRAGECLSSIQLNSIVPPLPVPVPFPPDDGSLPPGPIFNGYRLFLFAGGEMGLGFTICEVFRDVGLASLFF